MIFWLLLQSFVSVNVCWAEGPNAPAVIDESAYLALPSVELVPASEVGVIKVGDVLEYSIQGFTLPADAELVPPSGQKPALEQGFKVTKVDSTHLKIVPLRGGKNQLGTLLVEAGGKQLARTFPIYIEAQSAIQKDDPERDKPIDFKPPLALRFPYWVAVFIALVALGLIFFGMYGLYRLIQKHRLNRTLKPTVVIPEDDEALSALLALSASDWIKTGQHKKYYFRTSEVLKNYLARRYEVDAQECTSEELVRLIESKVHGDLKLLDQLETLCLKMDLIKFTDQIPAIEDAVWVLEEAKQIVVQTRKRKTPNEV